MDYIEETLAKCKNNDKIGRVGVIISLIFFLV